MRVNVDTEALTDGRIKRLAMRLGWSHFEALGRLVHVWAYLYHREGAPLHPEEIDAVAEREGVAATMVAVGLATETPEGVVIAGRRRAEWVADRRDAAVAGGEARARTAERDGGKFRKQSTKNQRDAGSTASVAPASHQPNTSPLAPAPALALALEEREPALELTPSEPKPAKRGKAAGSPHLALAAELWAEQDRLRQEAIPGCRKLAPTEGALKLVAARLADGHSAEDCRHVLQVYAADAKANPATQAEWFNGETNWVAANFRRALGRSTARASPDPRRGSVKPLAAHEYPVDKVEF